MYLARTIDQILESKKDKLIGRSTHFYICDVLTRAFRKIEPFRFQFELYDNYDKEDYSVSGIYDQEADKKYVVLNFSKTCKTFTIKPEKWKEFKFSISQVCQHEAIHQCQWSMVADPSLKVTTGKLDFRQEQDEDSDKEYLADPDEIDAYGHDIAMEIKFYYPNKSPYDVLRSINRHKKLWSYKYYKRTYKGEDWSPIRNQLLKKTYKWLPHVYV